MDYWLKPDYWKWKFDDANGKIKNAQDEATNHVLLAPGGFLSWC